MQMRLTYPNEFNQIIIEYKNGYYITYNGFDKVILSSEFKIRDIKQMILETKFRVVKNGDINTLYLYPSKEYQYNNHIYPKKSDNVYTYDGNTKNSTRRKMDKIDRKLDELEHDVEETEKRVNEFKKEYGYTSEPFKGLELWEKNLGLILAFLVSMGLFYNGYGFIAKCIGILIAIYGLTHNDNKRTDDDG